MNVLILHNHYRQAGGEERSVAEISTLLQERGHRVELLERASDELIGPGGRGRAAASMLRGGEDPGGVADAVRRVDADIVHAHNLNPLFGWRALEAARQAGARVVMHLHNYRLVCAVGTCFRDGALCTLCHARSTSPGLRKRCRGGLAESAVYALAIARQQPKVLDLVDRFVVPSAASLRMLGSLGLPTAAMTVLPNFLRDEEFAQSSTAGDGNYALFAGRLTQEKGAAFAVEICAEAGVPLVVAGEGPDAARLHALAAAGNADVQFAGHVDATELGKLRRGAALALLPSLWNEPCPYAAIEALACGLPVLASDVGGLPEIVGDGNALPAADGGSWVQRLGDLWSDRGLRASTGEQALAHARATFSADRFYAGLLDVYND